MVWALYEDESSLGRERRLVAEFDTWEEADAERARREDAFDDMVQDLREDEARRGFGPDNGGLNPLTEYQADRHYFVADREDVEHEESIYRA